MNKIITTSLLVLLFKFCLDFTYVNFVNPVYGGFALNLTNEKLIESYILTLLLSLLITVWFPKLKMPSYSVIYILFFILITPMLSYYAMADMPRKFIYMALLSLLIVMFIVKFSKNIKVFYILEGRTVLIAVLSLITLYVFANLIINGGFTRLSFNLADVYEVRDGYVESKGFLMGYFLTWQAYSVNTLLLAYFLYNKKRNPVIIVTIAQLLLFGMSGFKSYLYAPFLIFGIHFILNRIKVNRLFPYFAIGSIFIIMISYALFHYNGDILTPSIFIRRLFFVPAQLHFIYYDFFQENPFIMLSNSLLSFAIDNPYGEANILHLISNTYFGKEFGVNVGYIGNAYANFGFFGVILFSVFLGYTLKLLDSVSVRVPVSVSVSVIIIPAMAFVNSGFFTVLMTHGFLFSCIALWLLSSTLKAQDKQALSIEDSYRTGRTIQKLTANQI
ncbi:oligosaccharide repeat unit polymerase [Bacillus sp. FJAT-49705]|uniref:Oligosaccharide repeat unit polymerase n=1 Tax=Cytobacillus citreus TaxID=2833586 RepID=A0ABS5NYC7_9BACI|nr:O-antigen polymerase [Cytobacillus citreus]MBS4192606.1 oligosaccharide repeat unit polymerase [Cytobacillus citreus]